MPSKRTIAEAYWQYTRQREESAMDEVRHALHMSVVKNDRYSDEYRKDAEKALRRVERLNLLAAKIVGRMMK